VSPSLWLTSPFGTAKRGEASSPLSEVAEGESEDDGGAVSLKRFLAITDRTHRAIAEVDFLGDENESSIYDRTSAEQ
jgi:hypothetical protein